ncbi:Fur-regulated basic protein FbpA [Aeribacillus composti]|uniref:Fur-regulated basic protein FbpA n=1 Tax=Aeribacillus composti TaxID=1868734 RepID=UPI002E1D0DAF|nr:Fur-regulated basic protein FbpA [Aeribacillus composti]
MINKLIVLNAFKNEEQLCKLTLSELEYEYKKTQRDSHPHSETGLIRWTSKKL